jgi:hypothetical protein
LSRRPEWRADNAAGDNIADILAQGRRGQQLLGFYAKDVTATLTAVTATLTAAFGEVTLPALTLYVHTLVRADQILKDATPPSG